LEVLLASLRAPLCTRNAGSLETTLAVLEAELHEVRKFTWELKSRLDGEFLRGRPRQCPPREQQLALHLRTAVRVDGFLRSEQEGWEAYA
jgi:hypothetical protein